MSSGIIVVIAVIFIIIAAIIVVMSLTRSSALAEYKIEDISMQRKKKKDIWRKFVTSIYLICLYCRK